MPNEEEGSREQPTSETMTERAAAAPRARSRPTRRWGATLFGIFVILPILLLALWTTIALNLTDAPVSLPAMKGTVIISTTRTREGQQVEDALALSPWEGAICSSAST